MTTRYKKSKDYAVLVDEILAEKEISCFVDYSFSPSDKKYRDVAKAYYHKNGDMYLICVRGFCYADAFSREEFIMLCEILNVEFFQECDG